MNQPEITIVHYKENEPHPYDLLVLEKAEQIHKLTFKD